MTFNPGWNRDSMSAPVIVVGMHRSGTTLLTKILEAAGVYWGKQRDEYNEELGFQALNEQLFEKAGATWDRPEALAGELADPDFTEGIVKWIEGELPRLERDFFPAADASHGVSRTGSSTSGLWGWKDPRNTFTLPLMVKIFPSAKVVHIQRNGIDAAVSLWKRETSRPEGQHHHHFSALCQSLDGCFSLWKTYLVQAGTIPAVAKSFHELKFEDLVTDTDREVERLLGYLEIEELPPLMGVLPKVIRDKANVNRGVQSPVIAGFAERVSSDPMMVRLGYS